MIPQRLRAPREHGVLCHPPPDVWPRLLTEGRACQTAAVGGMSWLEFRRLARAQASELCGAEIGDGPIVLSGHQPELVHPGVWIKNLAACGFARTVDGAALHIATDNDDLKSTQIAVLGGLPEQPLAAFIPFDAWTGETPMEGRGVVDEATFRSFAARCLAHMKRLGFEPIVGAYWEVAAVAATRPLGERFGELRRAVERKFGGGCAETALGRLCAAPNSAFLSLAAEVLVRLPDYAGIYNEELQTFRRRNRLRSRHHPAPPLAREDDWIEAPLWAWTADRPIRRRPFARTRGGRLQLRIGAEIVLDAAARIADIAHALDVLRDWMIRPRALLTTGFLRLGIADLFLHGIGGARYDEWNDAVIRRFWNLEPPPFAVVTATLRLPTAERHPDPSAELQAAKTDLRRVLWNPESALDDELLERAPISNWIEERAGLLEAEPTSKRERRARGRRLRELTERIREFVGPAVDAARQRVFDAERRADRRLLAASREYCYLLHPAQSLQSLASPVLDWQGFVRSYPDG